MPITPGRVAWYVTGRFYLDQQGQLQDLGYFLHLEGVQGSPFNPGAPGAVSEASARFTFRSEPFQSEPITNGNVAIGLDTRGEFSVYFNPEGGCPCVGAAFTTSCRRRNRGARRSLGGRSRRPSRG